MLGGIGNKTQEKWLNPTELKIEFSVHFRGKSVVTCYAANISTDVFKTYLR